MSHNTPESSNNPSSPMEHDSHHDAHVHGLRLVLGSILAPKRPSPPSHSGSYPASGTTSPFQHWQHHPGPVTGTGTGHDTPPLASSSSPPHASPVVPHYQPPFQQPYQHAHQPTPSMHPHHLHHHAHVHPQQPQPQPHTHVHHASGPSRLSFTHSSSSTPSESLSPSPTPSPRLATPPPALDHAPHTYPHGSPVSGPPVIKNGAAANADAADAKRAHFIKTLQSKSAWDAMIHGSWV